MSGPNDRATHAGARGSVCKPDTFGQSQAFVPWFATHLGQHQLEVQRLLNDPTAVHFLIAWSLLETECFNGFATCAKLRDYCMRVVEREFFDAASLASVVAGFHERYQDKKCLARLMQDHTKPDIKPLLEQPVAALSAVDQVYLVISVVYRYRNNIFHGTKGVQSWLKYRPQIEQCVSAMQHLITHAKVHVGAAEDKAA